MDITAFMPIYARPRFTLRWLWHANRIKFPYLILIGDGSDNALLRNILVDRKHLFPNLKYQYFEYKPTGAPPVQDYFYRCTDVLEKVKTPFVLLCDSDDFPCLSGVRIAETQLKANPNVSSAGGWNAMIALREGPSISDKTLATGEIYRYHLRHKMSSITNSTALERVCECLTNHRAIWNHLQRTEYLTEAYRRAGKNDQRTINHVEHLLAMQILINGPSLIDPSYTMIFRQNGASIAGPTLAENPKGAENDKDIFLGEIARLVALKDGIELSAAYNAVKIAYPRPAFPDFTEFRPSILRKLARLPLNLKPVRKLRLKFERSKMFIDFKKYGADYRLVSDIDKELSEFASTIENGSFMEFLRENDLLRLK